MRIYFNLIKMGSNFPKYALEIQIIIHKAKADKIDTKVKKN